MFDIGNVTGHAKSVHPIRMFSSEFSEVFRKSTRWLDGCFCSWLQSRIWLLLKISTKDFVENTSSTTVFHWFVKIIKVCFVSWWFSCFCGLLNGQPCWKSRIRPLTSSKMSYHSKKTLIIISPQMLMNFS